VLNVQACRYSMMLNNDGENSKNDDRVGGNDEYASHLHGQDHK